MGGEAKRRGTFTERRAEAVARMKTSIDRFRDKVEAATEATEPLLSEPCTCGGNEVHMHVAIPEAFTDEQTEMFFKFFRARYPQYELTEGTDVP
jgi:hypothetical protein